MARAVAGESRTALAALSAVEQQGAILWEDGRQGQFVYDASDLSAVVASDTHQGIFIPPSSDPTGASGAWVRQRHGPASPHWFGLSADNTPAENSAAWSAMMATFRALAEDSHPGDPTGFYRTGLRIRFVDDLTYNFSEPLDIEGVSVIVEGVGPVNRFSGTRLQFTGTTGVTVNYGNSAASGTGGTWSRFKDLVFEGDYDGGAEAEYHAISSSDRIEVDRCTFRNWAGDGIRIVADSPTGNANAASIRNCMFENCRTGLYISGADANNVISIGNDYAQCRRWGEWRQEFLGGTSINPQAADCGITSYNDGLTVPATIVHHSGHRYYVKYGQSAGASTNAPSGTTADNTWWMYLNDLATADGAPVWFSGILVREGGSYCVDSASAATVYINPYHEGGTAPPYFEGRTTIIGGQLSEGADGTGVWLRNSAGAATMDYLDVNTRFRTYGGDTIIGPATGADGNLHFQSPTNGLLVVWEGAGVVRGYDYCNAIAGRVVRGEQGVSLLHGSTAVMTATSAGLDLTSGAFKVAGTQVVGARGAAVADATDAASVITQLNALLARLRTHGLIAA